MNILIENHETLEYLTEAGIWSKKTIEAKCFSNCRIALRAAKQEAIGKFNIVGHIPTIEQFVNLNHGRGTGASEADD
jgi:hypothetical protein